MSSADITPDQAEHIANSWSIDAMKMAKENNELMQRIKELEAGQGEPVAYVRMCVLQIYAAGLLEALQTLMRMDVNGHELQDRLQFSEAGRAILNKCCDALNSTPPDLSAVEELVRDANILRSRQIIGWMRGRDFIDLPEKARSTDMPVFILDAAMLAAHKKDGE